MIVCRFETREAAGAVDLVGRAALVVPNFAGMGIEGAVQAGLVGPSPVVREVGEIGEAGPRVVVFVEGLADPRRAAGAGQVGPNFAVRVVVARIGPGIAAVFERTDSTVAVAAGSSHFVAGMVALVVQVGPMLQRVLRGLCGRCGCDARCRERARRPEQRE